MSPFRPDVPIACGLAGLTGAAGLIDQIVWQRALGRTIGGDALATAVVLGVFLGGLSLGLVVFGAVTRRPRRLLAVYGATEAFVGVWALAFPALAALAERIAGGLVPATPAGRIALAVAVAVPLIGPPTVAMGATVPMLTRALAASIPQARRVNALIYGFNAGGAAVGALAAAFALLPALGLTGSLRFAASLNLLAAAWFLLRGLRSPVPRPPARSSPAADSPAPPRLALHAVAFLGGFAFMTLETAAVRLTGLTLGASVLSLAMTVAAFVVGIALGSLVVARIDRLGAAALPLNQSIAALALVALFPLLDDAPWAAHRLRLLVPSTDVGFWGFHAAAFAALTLALAVPAGCMGATLPLAFRGLVRDVADSGRAAGALFAWNALGNLLGGILGGFAAYLVLDLGEIWLGGALLVALTALIASVPAISGSSRTWRGALAAAAIVVAVAAWFPSHDPLRFAVGTFRLREPLDWSNRGPAGFYEGFFEGRTVLRYTDGPDATVAVVENPLPEQALARRFPDLARSLLSRPDAVHGGPRPRSVTIDGKSDSSTWYDRSTLRLLADLPALLAERRASVLIVGLGTGVTAAEIARYPDVERIDVAELSPEVVAALPLFGDWTGDVHLDPRLHVHTVDAYRLLRGGTSRWDLILSQPSNPWMAGNAALFSREFIAAARDRLADGGLFVEWIQRYATNDAVSAIALNTVRDVFPHVLVARTEADGLVLASTAPFDRSRFSRVDATLAGLPGVRRSLAEVGIDGAADLEALRDDDLVRRADELRGLGIETLDRPRLRWRSHRAFFRGDAAGEREEIGR